MVYNYISVSHIYIIKGNCNSEASALELPEIVSSLFIEEYFMDKWLELIIKIPLSKELRLRYQDQGNISNFFFNNCF